MATTAEELIVSLRAENAEETKQSIESVEEGVDETADSLGDAADQMQGFQQEFRGALRAAVAAVAIAVGGLLSTVPVLGGTMEGLGAILEAVGLQIDGLLRKLGAGGLNAKLFEIAGAINNLEGSAADLFAVFSIGATIVGVFLTALTLGVAKISGIAAAAGSLVAIGGILFNVLSAIVTGIAGVVAGTSALAAGVAIAVAAIIGFVAAYLTNFRGARDKTNKIVGQIVSFVVNGFNRFVTKSLAFIDSFTSDVVRRFNDLAGDLDEWATNLVSDAFTWGKNLIQRFIDGLKQKLSQLRDTLDNVRTEIEGKIGVDVSDGDDSSATSGPIFGGGTSSEGFQIDGRNITESTGRYRRDKTNRRGL